jgi:hypothetical protein
LAMVRRPEGEDRASATQEMISQARSFLNYCEPLLIAEAVSAA